MRADAGGRRGRSGSGREDGRYPARGGAWYHAGMTEAAFRKLALSMPGAHEEPHFARTSFRVGKRIFATMTADGTEAMVPVRPVARCLEVLASDPKVFLEYGGWTRRLGSLGMRLRLADAKVVARLVRDAWEHVARPDAGASGRRKRSAEGR